MHEKKHNISPVKHKIIQYVDLLGITKYSFYKKTGITRGMLDAAGGVSEENVFKFLKAYPDVSPNTLFEHEGLEYEHNNTPSIEQLKEPSEQYIIHKECDHCKSKDIALQAQSKTITYLEKLVTAYEANIDTK